MLILLGVQDPVIPLSDTVGNAGAAEFRQSGPTGTKAGSVTGLTVTVKVVVSAH